LGARGTTTNNNPKTTRVLGKAFPVRRMGKELTLAWADFDRGIVKPKPAGTGKREGEQPKEGDRRALGMVDHANRRNGGIRGEGRNDFVREFRIPGSRPFRMGESLERSCRLSLSFILPRG